MNRRGFLGRAAAAAMALTIDPETFLWVPGKKKIFIPAPTIKAPRLIVGIAKNDIAAGNYGYIQVYGQFCNDPQIKPSGTKYFETPSLKRYVRVQAPGGVSKGQIVYSDEVDYGAAPLWYTQGQNDIGFRNDW